MNGKIYIITISIITLLPGCKFSLEKKIPSPVGLTCELLSNPADVKIEDKTPEFSWEMVSNEPNKMQIAFLMLVASSKELLEKDTADMWQTPKIYTNQSNNIEYFGKPLSPYTSYYWKVKIWNNEGKESDFSKIQEFHTGKLDGEYKTIKNPLAEYPIFPKEISSYSDFHFIDFGKTSFGSLHLKLKNLKDQNDTITVRLGEKLKGKRINSQPSRSNFYLEKKLVLSTGERKYTIDLLDVKDVNNDSSNRVIPFRYCELDGYKYELEQTNAYQVVVHYPFDEMSSYFDCSEDILNQVWNLCKHSIKATTYSGIYINEEEKQPIEADAYINQLAHYYLDKEYNLARYTHEYLLSKPTSSSEWHMHSLLMAWEDYMFTGNAESIEKNYDILKAKTLWQLSRNDGLISTRTNKVSKSFFNTIHLKENSYLEDMVDWPPYERDNYVFKRINTVVNAFHYKSLQIMSEIALVLDRRVDYILFSEKAELVKNSINKVLLDPGRGIYVDGEGTNHSSLHANIFPLAFGVVPEKFKKSVVEYIKTKGMACSVYGATFLFEALYHSNEDEYAFNLLTSTSEKSWWNMILSGSTITSGNWSTKDNPTPRGNYARGAAPAFIIPRWIFGIKPLEPGFETIQVKPQVGLMKKGEIKVPSIKGPIEVKFETDHNTFFNLRVNIPANTKARIYLPSLVKDEPGITVVNRKNHNPVKKYIILETGPGQHDFTQTK